MSFSFALKCCHNVIKMVSFSESVLCECLLKNHIVLLFEKTQSKSTSQSVYYICYTFELLNYYLFLKDATFTFTFLRRCFL